MNEAACVLFVDNDRYGRKTKVVKSASGTENFISIMKYIIISIHKCDS